jgi:hypothetical protein
VDAAGNAYMLPLDYDYNSYITIKYDVNGNAAWTNFFKSSATSFESAYDVAVDAAGNVFVTGSSFDSGGDKCLTINYAGDGSVLWTNRFSFSGSGSGTRVIVDQQGNIIVAGETHGVTVHKYGVVKYSNSGTALWTNIITAAEYAGGGVPVITTDPVGNVFLVGGTPGATTADFTTIKYSTTGVPLWTNRFVDSNAGNYSFFGAATDNAGNLFWSIASASPSGANYKYVTVKYAANGVAMWTNRYNGPANASDLPRAMTVDKAGGVYVTGTSSSGGTSFSALDWATVKYADNLRYVPPMNYVGLDTITFTAFDSFGNSATGTVVIDVRMPAFALPATVVAPDAYTTIAGNGSLNTLVRGTNAPRTYQMQFTPNALGGLPVGARITELRFRASTNTAVSFPALPMTWTDYEVTLAQAANPITSMSTASQANLLNPVRVKDGPLSIGVNNFSAGSDPNPFGAFVVLDTLYVYQGGDLVMHFTHTGGTSTNTAFLDAANSSAPGYGTAFRAISAGTFSATSGTAASVNIVEIVFTPSIIQTATLAGNQLIINGAGGVVSAPYRILTTTNAGLPLVQWTAVVTSQFGVNGGFKLYQRHPAQLARAILPSRPSLIPFMGGSSLGSCLSEHPL